MPLTQLHAGLANTAVLFIAALGIWALVMRFTNRPLNSSWFGAAAVGEMVILLQGVIGALLYFQGLDAALARPYMHILYGAVAVVTLPAAYGYFGSLEDEKLKALAMAFACFFLWGILLRASNVAQFIGPIP
jgi:hypothetical protein